MKLAIVILAAVLLLAGCGHAKDPFVGTWQSDTPAARLTIDGTYKTDGSQTNVYIATLLSSRAAADITLVRHGNELRVDSSQLANMARAVIDEAQKHHEWEEFSRMKLMEGAPLQRYYPLHPSANEEYEAWREANRRS